MRIPPNLKYFLLFLLFIGVVALATIYLPKVIPNIGQIVIGIISVGMFALFLFVFAKPFVTFLYARADGIFEVFMDAGEKVIHIFAYHLNSDGEYGDSTRDIQHYYFPFNTGKVFFRRMFTHSMTPSAGRSGWGDFYSFEESVLDTNHLPESMQKLSAKSGLDLKLGRQLSSIGDNEYEIHQDEFIINIRKFESATDEGLRVTCIDRKSGRRQWEKKI